MFMRLREQNSCISFSLAHRQHHLLWLLAEGGGNETRQTSNRRIPSVGRHDREMHQPQHQGVEKLRWPRNFGLRTVAELVFSVSDGHGNATIAKAFARQVPRQQRELPARKRQMGNHDRTATKSTQNALSPVFGAVDPSNGGRCFGWNQAKHHFVPTSTRLGGWIARSAFSQKTPQVSLSRWIARTYKPVECVA